MISRVGMAIEELVFASRNGTRNLVLPNRSLVIVVYALRMLLVS